MLGFQRKLWKQHFVERESREDQETDRSIQSAEIPDFSLRDRSSYRDEGENLSRQYWVDRGHLVVQGGIDYSAKHTNPRISHEHINTYALAKLESYGFHKSHCLEALELTGGDVGVTLEVLLSQYFKLGLSFPFIATNSSVNNGDIEIKPPSSDILQQREEEKCALESIYDSAFEERIANRLWILNLQLDYLLDVYEDNEGFDVQRNNKKSGKKERDDSCERISSRKSKPQPEFCRFFAKGSCKYAQTCRFSHQPVQTPVVVPKEEKEKEKPPFQLEIRFPEGSCYPLEPALVYLTTSASRFPPIASLRLTSRLLQEAQICAKDEIPAVYTIAQLLLDHPDEMVELLRDKDNTFLDPNCALFPPPSLPSDEISETLLETAGRPAQEMQTHINNDSKSAFMNFSVNPEKAKYMIMSRDQNIVRNGNIKIGDLSFEQVEKFKYLGATVTNINDTQEEIKRRINMGNACCYSVEKLLSSSLLSKNLKVRIYKTVILPVVLYGCETWTPTLREEHRLRMFENKVLRKIFGAKRDEVTGEWRKLHNTELHALYSSPDIIRNLKSRCLRWAGHVARMGESRNAYRVLVGRAEGKRPLGRPRRRWEDNIKMDLREVGEDSNIARRFLEKQGDSRYKKALEGRRQLPAWSRMEIILNAVKKHQVVVVSGETGCGKSTQVPQFLLDDWLLNWSSAEKSHLEIICTQPRRLSAIGVAERVAEERVERIGNTIGYQIRLESKMSSSTRLLFCTTGILLRRLESEPQLNSVSHIIVDEVHERSEESDFLLLILRDLLPFRPDLKVILMSATLNAALFSSYFEQVPTIEIPGRTFPVEQLFLEDILEKTNFALEENSMYSRKMKKSGNSGPGDISSLECELEMADIKGSLTIISNPATRDEHLTITQLYHRYKDYNKLTCKNLYLMDPEKINYDLIETVLTWIVAGEHNFPRKGAILVFLPGMAEISSLHDQLMDHPVLTPRSGKFVLVPLHSTLTSEEQAAVFKKPKPGVRKIVLSTNIAETSVTIDDCVYVVDCGKMKEKRFDSNKNMESLELVWVSQANALQRKGRAGRVMPGVCIHLFTKHRYDYHFLKQPIPELHRVPLEQLLLRIKTLSHFADRNPHEVLGK
ncbi:hypothetical protein ANN_16851 [Periplaneta americana]|uniref:ATP-dependent RNA helicase DHX57 n=1 Tax=Periplaneta americana TaxID=6978 RepID=A0ABQ8SR96_PERAM|nr:hypothetical protein ANN_16851 [Periplaneta americana]